MHVKGLREFVVRSAAEMANVLQARGACQDLVIKMKMPASVSVDDPAIIAAAAVVEPEALPSLTISPRSAHATVPQVLR